MLKLSIPVIDGSNGRFDFEYLGCYSLVSLFDGLVHFFLLDGEVTFPEGAWIIPGVAMFLDLVFGSSHDGGNSIDESLILSFHLISFEVWHSIVVIW